MPKTTVKYIVTTYTEQGSNETAFTCWIARNRHIWNAMDDSSISKITTQEQRETQHTNHVSYERTYPHIVKTDK
jgi:hypothetical protein